MIWNGCLPLQISISEPDSYGLHRYYLEARRGLYIALYRDEIVRYFKRYLVHPEAADFPDWWFEYNGMPLSWHRPLGLLYDMLVDTNEGCELRPVPWKLSIHFPTPERPFPDMLLSLRGNALQEFWTNQFKEACYIRDGNSKAVLALSKDDSEALWKAVSDTTQNELSFETFWRITAPLIRHKIHIPLKVVLPGSKVETQRLIKAYLPDGRSKTLGLVLHENFGNLFPSSRASVLARPILHGISVPLATPLIYLYDEAMYCDGFLHICLRIISD